MNCSGGGGTFGFLRQFEFIKAITCKYSEAAGGIFVVGMFVFGGIALYLYIRQDSVVLPLGVLMMGGGSLMTVVVGPVIAIATIMILVVPAAYIAIAYNRRSPG